MSNHEQDEAFTLACQDLQWELRELWQVSIEDWPTDLDRQAMLDGVNAAELEVERVRRAVEYNRIKEDDQ